MSTSADAPEPSPASLTGSPTGDLLGDGGPEFNPDAAPEPAAVPTPGADAALAGGDLWTLPRVKGLLTAKGALLHGAIAVDKSSTEWQYTQADLQSIAPALTRILNRYDATRAAAAGGDELIVAVGFAGYAARSISERRAALVERAQLIDRRDDVDDVDELHDDVEPAAAAGLAPVFPEPGAVPPIAPRR